MRSLDISLARGRASAEARMSSRCTIRRRSTLTTQDEASGEETPTWTVLYEDVPFRFGSFSQAFVAKARISRVATGAQFEQAIRAGHLPARITNIQDNDLIEITAGESAGRVLKIVEGTGQDQSTARRVSLLEVDRPQEW